MPEQATGEFQDKDVPLVLEVSSARRSVQLNRLELADPSFRSVLEASACGSLSVVEFLVSNIRSPKSGLRLVSVVGVSASTM